MNAPPIGGAPLANAGSSGTETPNSDLPLGTGSLDAGRTPVASASPDASTTPLEPEVGLPPGVSARFPRGSASGVCTDVALRLEFSSAVSLGTTGSIRIFDAARPGAALDAVDMAGTLFPDTVAGRAVNRVRPVFVDGTSVVVSFRRGLVLPNTSYFVTVDAGVFRDAAGASLGETSDGSWTFTTGAAPSPAAALAVDPRGAAPFCSVQGALDVVPANNTAPVTIDVAAGIYHELLYVTRKSGITLRGADRDATVIAYPNNDNLNAGTAARSMFTALDVNDFVIEDLTLHNLTPQGGSQAEALRVRGERNILRNANFLSLQDTLLLDGSVYVADSYIEGNVDFIWGYGTAYFERSEIKVVGRSGVIVQSRNDASQSGYVFVDSRLTSDPGITNTALARIDATVYPNSQVAFVDCQMGPHISAAGWTITPAGADASGLGFGEFRSTDLDGQLLNVSGRLAGSRQLSAAQATALRDRASVLGGWDPVP